MTPNFFYIFSCILIITITAVSFIHVDLNLMKWDRINRKWLLPFENSDYSPFDLFLGLLPLPHFSKVSKVSKACVLLLFVDINLILLD